MTQQTTQATVIQMESLTDTILKLILAPEHYIDYQAGQYLQLLLGDMAPFYSIANAPLGSHQYELHIRHNADNPSEKCLIQTLNQQGMITLCAPFGECDLMHLDALKPILFIAAGTGFAPIKALLEQLWAQGDSRPLEFIWSVRSPADLYLDTQVKRWQNHVQQFQYLPLLSLFDKTTPASAVIARHSHDLSDWQILISGSFDMVYRTRDQLVAYGVSVENLYSDAFQFEGQ